MSGKHILAFEADPLYASLLKDALGSRGYTVEVIADGVDGLEIAASSRPALIYLCVELPRISGFSVCQKIRKSAELKDIPLILASADATDETLEKHKSLKVRADEYVRKPFGEDEIAEVVEQLIGPGSDESDDILIDDDSGMLNLEEIDESVGADKDVNSTDDDDEVEQALISLTPEIDSEIDSEVDAFADEAFDSIEVDGPAQDIAASAEPDTTKVAIDDLVRDKKIPATRGAPKRTSTPPGRARTSAAPPMAGQASDAEVKRLGAENAKLSDRIAKLERELADSRSSTGSRNTASGRELLDLRELLNKKDRELLDVKDAANNKEKQLLDFRERNNELERARTDLEDKNIEAERKIQGLETKIEDLSADKAMLGKKAEDLQARIENLQGKIARLEGELEQQRSDNTADVERLGAEKEEALRVLLEQKEDEREKALAEQLALLESQREEALEAQGTQLRAEAEKRRESDLASQRVRHENEMEQLADQLQNEKQQELEEQSGQYEKKLAELEEERGRQLSELAAKLEDEEQQCSALRDEKAELESSLSAARDELARTHAELDRTNAALKETQAELSQTATNLESTERELGKTRQKLDNADAELEAARKELENQRNQIADLDATLAERDRQIAALQQEQDELNDVLNRNDGIVLKTRQALTIAAKLLSEIEVPEEEAEPS